MVRNGRGTEDRVVARRTRWLVAAPFVVGVVLACSPAPAGSPPVTTPAAPSPSPSPPSTATTPPTATPVPPTPTATRTAPPSPTAVANAAPIELQGTWRAMDAPVRLDLVLGPGSYRITRGQNTGAGKIAVTGDEIRFFGSSLCSGSGTYRWTIDGTELRLVPVRPDECDGRAVSLVDTVYTLVLAG
jgi:hypothetical protein